MGSKQRNVFKKHSIAQSTVCSPTFDVIVHWRPSRVTKEVKISIHLGGYDYGSELFNFMEGVKRHTFISRSLKGLSNGRLYGIAYASHSKARSKDNAIVPRGVILPGPDGKERLRDESDDKDLRDPTGWEKGDDERRTALFLRASLVLLIGFSTV